MGSPLCTEISFLNEGLQNKRKLLIAAKGYPSILTIESIYIVHLCQPRLAILLRISAL